MSPRLFAKVLSLEVRMRLSYRVDFWLNAIVGFLAQFGLVYFVWDAMFRESGREVIGGYTLEGMVAYYLVVIVLGRLVGGRDLEGQVSTDIYEGGLNRYLVFPARYFPFKYAQHLGRMVPAALPFFVLGGLAFAFLDVSAGVGLSPASVIMVIPVLALGNLLNFLIGYPIQLVAFWADNVWSLDVAKRFIVTFLGGMALPLTVFPDAGRAVLELLPFQFFYYFPARVALGQVSAGEWVFGMGVASAWCLVFHLVGRLVWHRGQLQYSGIGI